MALGNPPSLPHPTKETFIKKEFKNKSHRVLIRIQRRVSGGSLLRLLVPPGEKNSLLEKRVTHPPLLSPPNSHVTTVSGPRKKKRNFSCPPAPAPVPCTPLSLRSLAVSFIYTSVSGPWSSAAVAVRLSNQQVELQARIATDHSVPKNHN